VFNAAAPAGYLAVADGTSLIIANTGGAAFTLGAAVTAVPASGTGAERGTMTAQAAATQTRTLAGTPVTGEIWSAALTAGSSSAQYVVRLVDGDNNPATPKTAQSLNEVAAALAAAINANSQDAFTAFAVGAQVVVVERSGAAFGANFDVRPAVRWGRAPRRQWCAWRRCRRRWSSVRPSP